MEDKTYILKDNIPACDRDGIIQREPKRKKVTPFTAILLAVSIGLMFISFARLI